MAADDAHQAPSATATDAPLPPVEIVPEPRAEPKGLAAPRPDILVHTLAQYELLDEIGRGGVGRVVRARDRKLDRSVVLKIPIRRTASTRFEREALLTAQLEHPAIVPVHGAGQLDDGTPFYVMKLLDGRSLRDEFEAARELSQRLGLLPIIIAVCDAIAYAHSNDVIHRDLKPRNVIVGKFGETSVIDWGMAKRLGPAGHEDLPPDAALASETDGQTKVGTILGTPAYMAPEQARGEAVDKRADVYALGAMLYHLFTGHPPYAGKDSNDVVRRVVEGAPTALEQREPRVPVELAAIVRRAMAREPGQRYQDAGELSDDLRRYQTGRLVAAHAYSSAALMRRWLWKYRAPVAVASVAIVVLLSAGTLGLRRVFEERRRASEQRAAAEELVDFMLVDLRTRLRQLGKLALLDGIAGKVDRYYQRVQATWDELSGDELGRKVETFGILADVRESEGNMPVALEALENGAQLARRGVVAEPSELRAHQLVRILRAKAKLLAEMERPEEARSAGEEALRIIDERAVASADRAGWLVDKGALLDVMGYVETYRGDHPKSAELHLQGVGIQEVLLSNDPENIDVALDIINNLTQLAKGLRLMGRYEESLVRAARADELATRFAAHDPGNVEWQLRLARVKVEVGAALQDLGRFDQMIGYFERARDIRAQLAARDPENLRWQLMVAQSDGQLAKALEKNGKLRPARESIVRAAEILEGLVAKEPRNRLFLEWLYFTYNAGGGVEQRLESGDALKWYRKSLDVVEPMAADRTSKMAIDWLALALFKVGEEQVKTGMTGETIPNLNRAIDMLDGRLREQPSNRLNLLNLAGAHHALAEALAQRGDMDGAIEHLAWGTGLDDVMIAETRDPTIHLAAARMHNRMGELLDRKSALAAWASYERAAAILRKLDIEKRLPDDGRKDLEEAERALSRSSAIARREAGRVGKPAGGK